MQIDVAQLKDGDTLTVPPELLLDLPWGNIRLDRDEKKEKEIEDSLRKRGIIQPVVARKHPEYSNKLQLIAGYGRRDKAAKINVDLQNEGLPVMGVPVLIKNVDDQEARAIQIAENIQRQNLSLIEEAKAAQQYTTQFGGDREASAAELGWTTKKLSERLEILKCSDKVIEQLRAGHIGAGHCIVLAPFPHSVQDAQIDNVVANRVTVAQLRGLVGKVQLNIADARFDTADCQSCPNNTAPQLGLFGGTETSAKCAKVSCYRQKTKDWLDGLKTEAEERYGTVLFFSATSEKEVNTLSPEVVGADQFSEGCATCAKNVAVMDDQPGKEGLITDKQCIDKVCFAKKVALLDSPADSAPSRSNTGANGGNGSNALAVNKSADNASTKPKEKTKAASVSNTNTAAVIANHKAILRKAAANHYKGNGHFMLSVTLAALVAETKYKAPPFDVSSHWFKDALIIALGLTTDEVRQHTLNAITYMASESNAYVDTMISALALDKENAVAVATQAWEGTEDNLKPYFTKDIQQIAVNAGVDKVMESKKTGSWKQAAKGKKADLIKAFVEADADLSAFAPKEYLAHVTPK